MDLSSPTSCEEDKSMATAVAEMAEDDGTPQHVKTILIYLLESKDRIDALIAENERLYEELRLLREENTGLKNKLASNEAANADVLSQISSQPRVDTSPPKSDVQVQSRIASFLLSEHAMISVVFVNY
ncbi:hypothetical protein Q1695_003811 [Nippostrongylus brasiliensis]|nr:hypothetical protein Q1695_003811 [Nippostrongylus brasiliensis]